MHLELIKNADGTCSLNVDGSFILDGDTKDDSARLVELVAERLAAATNSALSIRSVTTSPDADGSPESVSVMEVPPAPARCQKCGGKLHADGLCPDLTCPYSDWPQSVPLEDMHELDADVICVKHGLIRAEVHSDDRVIEAPFEAHSWFVCATDDDILALAAEEWKSCEIADAVALHHENAPRVALLFEYVHSKNAIQREIGFECSVNPSDVMAWLRRQRHGLWARIVCEEAGVRFSQAEEEEIKGMWDWIGPHGNACDHSFDSLDEAAADAARVLGLDDGAEAGPLYLAYWSEEAFYTPKGGDTRQLLGPALFCESLCYDRDDIAGIAALGVGQSWESPDYGYMHTVRRVR